MYQVLLASRNYLPHFGKAGVGYADGQRGSGIRRARELLFIGAACQGDDRQGHAHHKTIQILHDHK